MNSDSGKQFFKLVEVERNIIAGERPAEFPLGIALDGRHYSNGDGLFLKGTLIRLHGDLYAIEAKIFNWWFPLRAPRVPLMTSFYRFDEANTFGNETPFKLDGVVV